MTSLTGRTFGHYHILERVGRGGMATVYRALDRKTEREVAIKFISPAVAENEQFLRRFRREVKVVARMDHPHILPVLDYGEQEGYAFLVMPLLEPGSLADRLQRGPVSHEEGGRLFNQVASALSYAHQRGVVHRDVKPSNILFDQEGNALLADFGLARPVEGSISLTGSAVIGTPAYMAPEQIQGGKVDARCDQYALGVLLFQVSTGALPFEAETPMGYLLKHVNEEFPSARMRNRNVPETIERVIRRATAKEPEQRFESVADMNQALQASLAHLLDPTANRAPTIRLPKAVGQAMRKARRRRVLRTAGAVAATLLVILVAPAFASGLLDLLEGAQSPAEGSAAEAGAVLRLTAQVATIEAISTALANSQGSLMSESEIQTAVVSTLNAVGPAQRASGTPDPVMALSGATESATPGPSPTLGAGSPSPTPGTLLATQTAPPGGEPSATPTPTSAVAGGTSTPTRTPSPSPTRTPSPSPTRTPSPSPMPTASPSPTRTPTLTHTASPAPSLTPSPTENVCAALSLGGFGVNDKKVWWTVSNGSATTVLVTRVVIDWPAQNGSLERIRFDSSSIWNGTDDSPPTDISSGWTGNRSLLGGSAKDLVFEFSSPAASSGYSLELYLNPDCQRSAGG